MPNESDVPSTNPGKKRQALTPCHHEFQVVMQKQSVFELIQRISDDDIREELLKHYWNGASIDAFNCLGVPTESQTMEEILCVYHRGQNAKFMPYNLQLRFSMRSSDVFLGLPFNIASYGALAHVIADEVGAIATDLVYHGTSYHMYDNTVDNALIQCGREVTCGWPTLEIKPFDCIDALTVEHFDVKGYVPQGALKAAVAV